MPCAQMQFRKTRERHLKVNKTTRVAAEAVVDKRRFSNKEVLIKSAG